MIDRGRPDPFLMNDNRPASWTPGGFNFDAGVRSLPTFGIEGHEQLIDLTRLWFGLLNRHTRHALPRSGTLTLTPG
jgi:hypothetical protein